MYGARQFPAAGYEKNNFKNHTFIPYPRQAKLSSLARVASWFVCKPKIPNCVNFGGP
jgi:hypothetical protein